jgi:hypothetical protein
MISAEIAGSVGTQILVGKSFGKRLKLYIPAEK